MTIKYTADCIIALARTWQRIIEDEIDLSSENYKNKIFLDHIWQRVKSENQEDFSWKEKDKLSFCSTYIESIQQDIQILQEYAVDINFFCIKENISSGNFELFLSFLERELGWQDRNFFENISDGDNRFTENILIQSGKYRDFIVDNLSREK